METRSRLLPLVLVAAVGVFALADWGVADVPHPLPPVGTQVGYTLDLPPELRTQNWGGGSCVHASNVTILRRDGLDEMADWWRSTYSGGEYDSRLVTRMEKAGLKYAYIHDGREGATGEAFLTWCHRTRRWAGIFYKPSHSINFVGLDEQYVYLLDNNDVKYQERNGHPERVPRDEFFRKWRGYGGFAWTLIYAPPPARPTL